MLDREYDHQAIQGGDESLEGFDEWREQYRLGEGYVDVGQEEDLADFVNQILCQYNIHTKSSGNFATSNNSRLSG